MFIIHCSWMLNIHKICLFVVSLSCSRVSFYSLPIFCAPSNNKRPRSPSQVPIRSQVTFCHTPECLTPSTPNKRQVFFGKSCEQWQVALVSSNCQFDRKANKILADYLSSVFAVVFVLSVCGLVSGLKWFAKWQPRGGEGYCDVIIIGWIAGGTVNTSAVNCGGGSCQGQGLRWMWDRSGWELSWDVSNCNFEFDSSLSLLVDGIALTITVVVCAQDTLLNLFWFPQIKRFKQPSNQQQQ